MRRLKPPTLAQWSCHHQWKTTHSLPQEDALHRVRYHKCLKCGLRAKTEEGLAVPWTQADLIAQVTALLPKGQAVALREKGITELPLARLNAILKRHGYVIHTIKGRDSKQFVACTAQDGRVEQYGLFELRQMPPQAPERTNGRRRQGRLLRPNDRGPEGGENEGSPWHQDLDHRGDILVTEDG